MATDLRLKEGLPEITEAIVATYTECRHINHLAHRPLPSREAVIDICEHSDLLFVNRFELSSLTGDPDVLRAARGLCARGRTHAVVVKRGPNAGSRFIIDRPSLSAPTPASDIFLDDITVSRRHAEFRRESGQVRIVDAGSLNGIYVNRQPVGSATLAAGDESRSAISV